MSRRAEGFTIVELTIAIAFLGVLLMAILTLTVTAGKLYIKGDTMKTVNQAGRDFSDTIRRDFLSADTMKISEPIVNSYGSGRICLGTVSYLWNTAALLNDDSGAANAAKVKASGEPIKFIRVTGSGSSSYCVPDGSGSYDMTIDASERFTELFGGTETEYALYTVTFTKVAQDDKKGLYRAFYTLGTNDPETTELDADGYVRCKPNTSLLANFTYCAVNDFDMVIRAGGASDASS